MEKFVLFKTKHGNTYYYSIPMQRLMYLHPIEASLAENLTNSIEISFEKLYSLYGKHYNEDEIKSCVLHYSLLYKKGYFMPGTYSISNFRDVISASEIENSLANCPVLVIETTERCNLECRYCIYGKNYSSFSTRRNLEISLKMAIAMVDYMIERWNSSENQSPLDTKYIGFYGGEPLLNFKLIKEVVLYLETKKNNHTYNIQHSITTNGLLLPKYIDFLVEHNFQVLISLDGGKEDNAARVFPNGEESFPKLINIIKSVKKKYPSFFKNNVSFNAVYNHYSDYFRLDSFFITNSYKYKLSELNPQVDSGSENYMYKSLESTLPKSSYEQFVFNDYSREVFDSYICDIHNSFLDFSFPNKGDILLTGTCMPFSRKIFITAQGLLLPCETIPHKHALGRVTQNGEINLDFNRCAEYYSAYYQRLEKSCKECYSIRNCRMCFFLNMKEDTKKCPQFMTKASFINYLTKNVEYYEDQNIGLFSDMKSEN